MDIDDSMEILNEQENNILIPCTQSQSFLSSNEFAEPIIVDFDGNPNHNKKSSSNADWS